MLDGIVRQEPNVIEAAMGEYFTAKSGTLTLVGVVVLMKF